MSSLSRWLLRRPVTRPRTPAPTPTRTILGRDLLMEDRVNPTPDLSVNSFVSTTQEGGSPADYGLFLNGAEPNQTITVHYSFGGTATHTDDYTASLTGGGTLPQTGTINMTADEWGSANAGINIDAIADGIPEPSENVVLTIDADPAYIINAGSDSTEVTIEGTIAEVSYYPSGTESMPEGEPGSYFLLHRTDTTGFLTVNVSYAGTATRGSDYTALTTATFQDGLDTSDPIGISTTDDTTPEGDETIILTVEPGPGYTVGSPASGTGMILEDDAALPTPTVEVYNSLDAAEGESDGDFAIFVTGAEPFADVIVSFTLGGTATDPDDYTPSKTVSVTVTADEFGDASTDVFITARPDNFVDPDETVSLTISDDPGYTITAGSATITIIDDPARVAIGPDTQDVVEGWQGGLTLSRSGGDLDQPLAVQFSLGADGYGDGCS